MSTHDSQDDDRAGGPRGPGLDHEQRLSQSARLRPIPPIHSLFPIARQPGMISFFAGAPNPTTFPLGKLDVTLKPEAEAGLADDGETEVSLTCRGQELSEALQYGATPGYPPLVEWLTRWQSHFHRRPIVTEEDGPSGHHPWAIQIGHGSQDLLTTLFNVLLDPCDSCLVERPVYAGIMPHLVTLQANVVAVEADEQGMTAVHLREVLQDWGSNEQTRNKRFPKFVLTTPTGANPSGTTAGEQRKRDVLQVVREYGLLLVEDDPYMLLAFAGLDDSSAKPETRQRCRTYWSIEQDEAERWGTGWVVRLDSFSKVLSAGMRVAFMTGPTEIVKHVESETGSTYLHVSGIAQVVTLKLLEHWGFDGFLRHGDSVARFYMQRRDLFEAKVKAILGENAATGQRAIATWITPVAGMFLWLRLKLPPTSASEEGDSFALINEKARARNVLAVPGMSFMPDGKTSCYVRTSYSIIPEEQIEEGLRRLRATVEDAWLEAGREVPSD